MKRFQSRIQSLTRLRQQAEKLARLTAAVRQGEKARADEQVEQIRERITQLQRFGAVELRNGNTAAIQSVISAAAREGKQLEAAKNVQSIAEQNLAIAVQQVAFAKADVQVVEKHKDKEFAEYRRKVLVDEENNRQENNGRRFAASKRNTAEIVEQQDRRVNSALQADGRALS